MIEVDVAAASCERGEAIQSIIKDWIASSLTLLAMTAIQPPS
jgi:hypothetical protein